MADIGRRVLITGGAGFIGSHTCLVLLEQGHELVVLDNFDNSSPEALRRVQELAGSTQLTLVEGDVREPSAVDQAFSAAGAVDGVIHFAGLKAVGESVANPLLYWDVNVSGSRVLAAAMTAPAAGPCIQQHLHRVRRTGDVPAAGKHADGSGAPYAQTKVAVPVAALCRSGSWWPACVTSIRLALIRAVGSVKTRWAFPTTCSRSSPRWRRPREQLRVFGNDYPTGWHRHP